MCAHEPMCARTYIFARGRALLSSAQDRKPESRGAARVASLAAARRRQSPVFDPVYQEPSPASERPGSKEGGTRSS